MENDKENKPKKRGNFIFRQELTNLTPECNAKCAIICNSILMILFFAFGGTIVASSNSIVEISQDYTNCTMDVNKICNVSMFVQDTIKAPIFLYYELNNFYMNHRDFVKSRIYPQLRGDIHVDSTNNSKCSGAVYIREIFDNDTSKYTNKWGKTFNADDFANPCGLIAKSVFNDTFLLYDENGKNITLNDTNISNDYDRKYMFVRNPNYTNLQWIDVENEHFIVWMQMETFPNFRKLWARIENDLQPGNYSLLINNSNPHLNVGYNVLNFNGKKFAVLSTSSALGTAAFFGYALIIGGCYCFVIILVLLVLYSINKNKNFDYNSLRWK